MRSEKKQVGLGIVLDWLQVMITLGAGIGLILDNFDVVEIEILRANLDKITFILICGLIVSSFLERRYVLQRIEETVKDKYGLGQRMETLGVKDIYQDRSELPRLEICLSQAKSDVLMVGITLYGLITRHRDLFEQRIRGGCFFRFLLPASLPEESAMAHIADRSALKRTRYDLERTFEEIAELAESIKRYGAKGGVELRTFDFVPTMGVIMLDSRKRSGSIRVELYPYASPVDKRPALEFKPSRREDGLYEYILKQYEALWENSRKSGGDLERTK